jgi:hypothetical protein
MSLYKEVCERVGHEWLEGRITNRYRRYQELGVPLEYLESGLVGALARGEESPYEIHETLKYVQEQFGAEPIGLG